MLVFIIIWIIGAVLATLRVEASFIERDEEFIDLEPNKKRKYGVFIIGIIFSWFAFLVGTIMYFLEDEKYFLKWKP